MNKTDAANARLMAAAPKLLAACKAALQDLMIAGPEDEGHDQTTINQVRAAIKLATEA